MKMMKYMTSIATALFALVACSDADDILSAYHNDPNAVHINAEVGKASADGFTRSNPLGKDADEQKKFNQDDEISVKADGQDAVTYQFNGTEWIPQDSKFLKWESENMTFTAYYPAASYSGGTIDQPQEYASVASLAAADYMSFNAPIDKPKDNNTLTLNMERQMARVVVDIVDFNDQYASGTEVKSVTINGTVKAYKHKTDGKFYALMVPCSAQNDKEFLSLEVGTGNTETLTGIPELVAGKSYTYQLTVGKNKVVVNGITVKDWTTDKTINDVAVLDDRPYLTFTAEGAQTFKMKEYNGYTISGLEYSVNEGEWKNVVADEGVSFGGTNSTLRLRGTNINGTASAPSKYSTITFTDPYVNVSCTGDIRTLLDYKNYKTVDTQNARFCNLFNNCTALTSAPDLPTTTLASSCYGAMFFGCANLVNAPALPAETLADECYSAMFFGCKNLVNAPALPAEALAKGCYNAMFQTCTSLTSAPKLPAKTLAYGCYMTMFYGCTSLTSAPELPATTLKESCYYGMFRSCTDLKTAPTLSATTLENACYGTMFKDCSNLETAPALPAETLKDNCYSEMFAGCKNLSSVTMMAPSDQIKNAFNCCGNWLEGAGTNATSRTLRVKNEEAYKALVDKNYLPDKWKKDAEGTTVEDTPYLTFTAAGAQTFKMTVRGGYDLSGMFEYSVNGGEWNKVVADKEVPFGGTNGTLSLRGTNPKGTAESLSEYSKITFIEKNVKVACTGDIRTLLNHANYKNVATDQARFCYLFEGCAALTTAPDLPAETLADDCYGYMFMNCTNLKTAPNLPAKTLASFCYYTMFSGCTSLETAPTLPAETLETACYGYMFSGCTNLKTAPELCVTALALICYEGMFQGCTSLEIAPTLPATKLEAQCYNYMFKNCTNLTSVTMLAPSDQISTNRLIYWLEGAGTNATSRTLIVKNADAYDALVNKSYLPAKWKKGSEGTTVLNASNNPIE